jgi:hypothetical protein
MTRGQQQGPVIDDRDRGRACRLAHVFGASVAAALALLLVTMTAFRNHPVPLAAVLPAGLVTVLLTGLLSDLAMRPARVVIRGTWLSVARLGRQRQLELARLTQVRADPRAAGSLVLTDDTARRAVIDVRCLARNPLMWERVRQAIARSHERGSLQPGEPTARLLDQVAREAARADLRVLAALDFQPAANHRTDRGRVGRTGRPAGRSIGLVPGCDA